MFSKLGSGWDEVCPLPDCMGSCMSCEPVVMVDAATSCAVPIPVGSPGGLWQVAGDGYPTYGLEFPRWGPLVGDRLEV